MNKKIIIYTLLTFIISWAIWIDLILNLPVDYQNFTRHSFNPNFYRDLATFGPFFAGIYLTWIFYRRPGLKQLIKRLNPFSVHPLWLLFSVLPPFFIVTISVLSAFLTGTDISSYKWPGLDLLLFAGIYMLILGGPLGEEIGWRGFLLPELLKKHCNAHASLITGIVWALWHLPLFYLANSLQYRIPLMPFMLLIIAASFGMTWLYLRTKGNLLVQILFHLSINMSAVFLPFLPMNYGDKPLYFAVLYSWILVAVLVYRWDTKSASHLQQVAEE